ncbi:MAG: hypothetical protein HY096_15665 [Nitrospinae bacterium]|nr:hypothetical protein [Nitrospinota bacterium]
MKTFYKLFVLVGLVLFPNVGYALSVETHKDINEIVGKVITPNGFSLNQYLIENLGFGQGIDEQIINQKVAYWLRDGGEYEDIPAWYLPYLRSVNHFHNPITDKGYSGFWGTGIMSGMSSTQWSLMPLGTQSSITGNYSWYDVRDYYYKALTNNTKTERDTNFAQTFRGLGQLIHLIQDVSVPEHTRDDGHYINLPWQSYEKWVKKNANVSSYDPTASHFFTGGINSIASFIDTNQYNGTNPSVTTNNNIGLSEFTNVNFLSWDTMFANFTYPSQTGAELWTDTTINRNYFKKTTEGVSVSHLAVSSFLYAYRLKYFPQYSTIIPFPLGMDSKVYQNYASLLLPRAVGYSAGLISYFFRGQINIDKDPNNSSQYVIKNETNEYMSGTFTLYYDDTTDNRRYLTSWNKTINANSTSDSVSITEPTDPLERGKYLLVFQGTMGNETGAVVGRVVKLEAKGRVLYLTSNPNYIAVTDGERTTPPFDLRTVLSTGETFTGIARFDRSDGDTFVIATSKFDTTSHTSGTRIKNVFAVDTMVNYYTEEVISRSSEFVATYTANYIYATNGSSWFWVWDLLLQCIYGNDINTTRGGNLEVTDWNLNRIVLYESYGRSENQGGVPVWHEHGYYAVEGDTTLSVQQNRTTKYYLHKFKIDEATFTIQHIGYNSLEKETNFTSTRSQKSPPPPGVIPNDGYLEIIENSTAISVKDIYINRGVVKLLYDETEEAYAYYASGGGPVSSSNSLIITTKYGEAVLNEYTTTTTEGSTTTGGSTTTTDPTTKTTGTQWNYALIANLNDVIYSTKTDRSRVYLAPDGWLWSSSANITNLFTYIRTDSGYSMAVRAAYSSSDFKRSFNSTEAGFVEYGGLFVNRGDLVGFKLTDFSSGGLVRFYVDSAKIKIDPALPNGYEITTISPLLTWDTTKLLDFILK